MYFDIVDYGPEAEFYHGARYDLVGYDVSTPIILVAQLRHKTAAAI